MHTKKTVYMLVCLSIVLLGAAGCSDTKGSSAAGDKQTTTKPTATTTEGEKKSGKLLDEPVTFKVMIPDSSPQIVKDAPVFKHIFEKTNVKLDLEPVPSANYDQKAQTLIATNNLPDIMRVPNGKPYFNEAAKNGMFLPISDYLDYAPNIKRLMKENKEIGKGQVNGKLYGFPLLGHWKLQLAQAPMIRMDLLKEQNLEVPKTYDDLYRVLKKFKEAYPDKIPFTNREGAANLLISMGFAMGSGFKVYYDPDVNGGEYVYGPAHAEFKSPLEFLNKLYKEKLLDPDYAVNTGDNMKEKLSSGRALFYFDNNSFGDQFNASLKPTNPNAQFEMLLPMQNDFGKTRNSMYKKDWLHHFTINSKIKNPKAAVQFLDWMYSDEGTLITNYGIEGEHFKMENGKPVIDDSIMKQFATAKDPFRNMQNALGVGFLAFALNVDEHAMAITSTPDLVRWSEMIVPKNGYVSEVVPPPFTDEEIDKLKTILSKVDTIVNQEIDKFVMGVRPMSDFDSFAQKLKDSGSTEIEKIYNEANDRYKKSNP
ncbi:extracellular solute-binding protein [Paenibacillus agricola]|uniref:Extracellular solute-binding protein n=1 Tax=Paenibacillus agricola TaxID=2716264 RepID=A0ABX0J9T7_9BACL|nr:extracellular solute-binding protein [Paenibacillus agricola]NHN32343.1 extracellular solute-binding protein [Paenibacillus agricola]